MAAKPNPSTWSLSPSFLLGTISRKIYVSVLVTAPTRILLINSLIPTKLLTNKWLELENPSSICVLVENPQISECQLETLVHATSSIMVT